MNIPYLAARPAWLGKHGYARVKNAKQELGIDDPEDTHVPLIKGQIRSHFERNVKEKKQSSFRLIIILIVLFAIAYWLLKSAADKL